MASNNADVKRKTLKMTPKLAAKFLGTFWLVLGGCGSAVLAAAFPELGIGFVGVSLAFGLTVLTGAYALGPISGGHFNPAVSVGLWAGASRRLSCCRTSSRR
jgi:aquaporin Z